MVTENLTFDADFKISDTRVLSPISARGTLEGPFEPINDLFVLDTQGKAKQH